MNKFYCDKCDKVLDRDADTYFADDSRGYHCCKHCDSEVEKQQLLPSMDAAILLRLDKVIELLTPRPWTGGMK